MKKITILVLMAAFALVSCQTAQKTATSPDVRGYGFTGDVRYVYVSTMDPELEAEGEDPWLEEDMLEFEFDELGRVVIDDYGNEFGYDEQGNFIRGEFEQSTLVRDANGRIVEYSNEVLDENGEFYYEDSDVFEMCNLAYKYDAKGRVETEEYSGWEWGSSYTYEYEGDAFYPKEVRIESYNEGYNENILFIYEYLTFDDKGNWTSRNVTRLATGYEEPWEEDMEPEYETTENHTRQFRKITYWSDED